MTRFLLRLLNLWSEDTYLRVQDLLNAFPVGSDEARHVQQAIVYARRKTH